MSKFLQHRNRAADPTQLRIIHRCLYALVASEEPQIISRIPWRTDNGMVSAWQHVDAVIAHGEIFLFAFFVVIMANAKAIVRTDLEKIHFLMIRLARQIVHLMFVRRIRAPISAGRERFADDQSSRGQFGLRCESQNLMEVAFEIRRASRASCHLRRFDYIRLDIQVRWRARQSNFHSRIGCNCEFGFGWDVDRMWFAAEDIRTSADFFESLRSNLEV